MASSMSHQRLENAGERIIPHRGIATTVGAGTGSGSAIVDINDEAAPQVWKGVPSKTCVPLKSRKKVSHKGPKDLRSYGKKKIPLTGGPWHLRRGHSRHSKYTPSMSRQWLQPSSPVGPRTPRSFCDCTSSAWRKGIRLRQECNKLSVHADSWRNLTCVPPLSPKMRGGLSEVKSEWLATAEPRDGVCWKSWTRWGAVGLGGSCYCNDFC